MLDYDISSCPLFSEIDNTEQEAFLSRLVSNRKVVEKGQTVARQGDEIKHLYLLVKGVVRTEMITQEGNSLEIEFIDAVRPLAPAFVFAHNNHLAVDVITMKECHFLLISKDSIPRTTGPIIWMIMICERLVRKPFHSVVRWRTIW